MEVTPLPLFSSIPCLPWSHRLDLLLGKREREGSLVRPDIDLPRKTPMLMSIQMTYPFSQVVSVIGLFLRCHIDNRLAFEWFLCILHSPVAIRHKGGTLS
ncbi:hypothetical protein L1987_89051 [Smallanthus sonchifolius]|nr:hypothetical protein L1987_89051 [Smallanthus sonchifolius]